MFWLVGLIDKFAFGTILTDRGFARDLGLTGHATAIGALASVAVLTQALGYGVFGWAVDRYGPRRCAVAGVSGWFVSCVLAALAHSVAVLVLSRVLLGLCEGYTWPVGNALTARWFPANRRARSRALWMSAVCIGPGISGFLTAGLLGTLSWRGVFWCLAAASLVLCMPLALWFVRDMPAGLTAPESEPEVGSGSAERGNGGAGRFSALRSATFWLATLAAAGTTIGVWALASWLPSYLVSFRHTSLHVFQYYVLTAYGIGLLLMLGYARVVDRLRRRSIWLAVALWVSGALLLLVGLVPAAPYLVLIAAVIAIIYGVTLLHAQGFQDQMTAVSRVGTENGLMNAVSNLLAGIVPFAMGGLIEADGGSFGTAFLFLFVLLAISGGCAVAMHRRGY
jgi:MFS family permease